MRLLTRSSVYLPGTGGALYSGTSSPGGSVRGRRYYNPTLMTSDMNHLFYYIQVYSIVYAVNGGC